jgi:hypothetical protein
MSYKNKTMKNIFCLLAGWALTILSPAQDTRTLTLDEAIERARLYSSEAMEARHAYRASYWNWRSFQVDYLPSLTFASSPQLNQAIESVVQPDGTERFVTRDQFRVDGSLRATQNVPLTGGQLYMQSSLQRTDLLTDGSSAYRSVPVVIGYQQDLLGCSGVSSRYAMPRRRKTTSRRWRRSPVRRRNASSRWPRRRPNGRSPARTTPTPTRSTASPKAATNWARSPRTTSFS